MLPELFESVLKRVQLVMRIAIKTHAILSRPKILSGHEARLNEFMQLSISFHFSFFVNTGLAIDAS